MNNKDMSILKKVLLQDKDFKKEYNEYVLSCNNRVKYELSTFNKCLTYVLKYVKEEINFYLKHKKDYEGIIYILDTEYQDISFITINKNIINLDVLFIEFIEFLNNN